MTTDARPLLGAPNYSRSQTLSVGKAMARALANRMKSAVFTDPNTGATFQFADVFETWPSFNDRYVPPAACVLRSSPIRFDNPRTTPALMRDTWEPEFQPGWGLHALADIETDFEVTVRAATDAEREAILAGVEQMWQDDQMLMDHEIGARYGVNLTLPEYWNLDAGFALKSLRMLDDEDRAMREQREAVLSITGWTTQVKLGPVRPMRLTIRTDVKTELGK